MAPAAQKWRLLVLYIATLIMILSPTSGVAWSASTIISIATDILETGDNGSLESKASDPLVDSIDRHGKRHDKVRKISFDGGGHPKERFLVPMLSTSVGDNNQFLEYMTAAVMARAAGRTLCLTPFFKGPIKHSGRHSGNLAFEDKYDVDELSKFVKVSSLDRCFQRCHRNIHGFWWLRHSSAPRLGRGWTSASNARTHDFGRDFTNWASINEIQQEFTQLNFGNEMCLALGGLFPGLRWRGAYLASSLYMRPSRSVLNLADALQNLAIGANKTFLAVHWRFEESLCDKNEIGTCFLRCGDGAVISSGLHATTRGLPDALRSKRRETESDCSRMRDSTKVMITKEDLVSAIVDKALKENVSSVYIATDGWMRGSRGPNLIRKVVNEIRSKGLSVSGLWKVRDLPNIIVGNGSESIYIDRILREIAKSALTAHVISVVEQELCFRARAFMGSGESTWSLTVFRARLASRRRKQLAETSRTAIEEGDAMKGRDKIEEGHIVEQILQDSHAAGLQCRYRSLYRNARNVTQESYQDESPDTWLDMEACEGRLGRGGSCQLFECSS